jgi:palmitoyltransferase ZDHHC13/17
MSLSERKEYLKKWIDTQARDDDSFTALHFASFFGNLYLIQLLLKHGANPLATNKCDINMLHVAAQGDQPISIAFFLSIGLEINFKDKRLSTALHWAAFAGSENAL